MSIAKTHLFSLMKIGKFPGHVNYFYLKDFMQLFIS